MCEQRFTGHCTMAASALGESAMRLLSVGTTLLDQQVWFSPNGLNTGAAGVGTGRLVDASWNACRGPRALRACRLAS